MDVHKNAFLTPQGRAELVRRVLEPGQAPGAARPPRLAEGYAAEAFSTVRLPWAVSATLCTSGLTSVIVSQRFASHSRRVRQRMVPCGRWVTAISPDMRISSSTSCCWGRSFDKVYRTGC